MDFSDSPIINTKYKFFVLAENETIYYDDYTHFNGMTLGIPVNCSQLDAIDELCEKKQISFEKKYYNSNSALEEALLQGDVDAIFAVNVSDANAFRVVTHFPTTPLYITSWQGNETLAKLNEAQKNIQDTFSYFEYNLYKEDIEDFENLIPYFTREEMAYIEEHTDIYFSADPNWAPIESVNSETGSFEGITSEIIDYLEDYTGLNFIYKPTPAFTASLEQLANGEIEMLTAFSHNYAWAAKNNVDLSSTYLNSNIVMVYNPNRKTNQNRVALPNNFHITDYIESIGNYDTVIYFDTTEACIDAVAKGLADYTYTNHYIANYHLSNITYRNLRATQINNINENLCIAVSKNADPRLLSIINKGLRCIPQKNIDAIVLEHTLYTSDFTLQSLIYAYPEAALLCVIGVSLLFIGILLIVLFVHLHRAKIMKDISQTDALTGILNRGAVQSFITMTLDKEKMSPNLVCPLIAIDLDNFKAVNDNYGHSEGDLLLKAVANVLTSSVRHTDIVGRMGGDEFIIYLTNVSNKKTAEAVASKLCLAVSSLALEKPEWNHITASFGVAFGNSHSTWSSLYHEADTALYAAKEKGKNQYSIYYGN